MECCCRWDRPSALGRPALAIVELVLKVQSRGGSRVHSRYGQGSKAACRCRCCKLGQQARPALAIVLLACLLWLYGQARPAW